MKRLQTIGENNFRVREFGDLVYRLIQEFARLRTARAQYAAPYIGVRRIKRREKYLARSQNKRNPNKGD